MLKFDFRGRVALITGGTSGIGGATARAFAAAGAKVAIAARHAPIAGSDAQGGAPFFVSADMRSQDDVAQMVAAVVKEYGRLDYAINCAGVGGDMAALEASDQAIWDDVMAINARGVWLSMRHQIPAMLATGGGSVVNLCSIYGAAGKAAHHAYVASKHAVLGLTRSVALEYATRGVRVNALCPGVTRTAAIDQAERAYPELVRALVAEHPMQRMATEEEVAGAALYLCSEEARFMTGSPLFLDGGYMAA